MNTRPRARALGLDDFWRLPPGPWNAITDVAGVQVGQTTVSFGEGELAPGNGPARTGVTVILPHDGNLFRDKVAAAAHTINGYGKACGFEQVRELGEIETPIALTNTLNVWRVADALVDHALAHNPDIGIHTSTVNPVVGECNDGYLNDIQGRHVSAEHVHAALAAAASGPVAEGAVGAGTGTTCYGWKGGIGTASEVLDTGVTIGAIAAVNAVGSIRDSRAGKVVAAPRDDDGRPLDVDRLLRLGRGRRQVEERIHGSADAEAGPAEETPSNTTLAVVATSARLTKAQANRIATVAHDGFARSIWPVHTRADGDVIFALATGEHEITDDQYPAIEAMAARAVERAILNGVRAAKGLAGVPGLADAKPAGAKARSPRRR